MSSTTNTAPIKWAQRSDSVYLTIVLQDVTEETITLSDAALEFKGKSGGKDYGFSIEFFKSIDSKGSTYKVLPRSIQMNIMKATPKEGEGEEEEEEEEFWPRLLKDKALEKNQVKLDWDRYVDEDEEEEAGGMDMSNLEGGKGFGGMPGMGGGGMPGMGGGGMPGMGGMGGMPGMGGGGMPGMGGMGGMDMEALMKQMGDMGGMGGGADGVPGAGAPDGNDSDDEDLPDLEEA